MKLYVTAITVYISYLYRTLSSAFLPGKQRKSIKFRRITNNVNGVWFSVVVWTKDYGLKRRVSDVGFASSLKLHQISKLWILGYELRVKSKELWVANYNSQPLTLYPTLPPSIHR